MNIDLSPLLGIAEQLAVLVLVALGAQVLRLVARKLGVQLTAAQWQLVDTDLAKCIGVGAAAAEQLAAQKGWDHVEVKHAIVAKALTVLSDHGSQALKAIGLDPIANQAAIETRITALLPSVMAPIAASPITTSGPAKTA